MTAAAITAGITHIAEKTATIVPHTHGLWAWLEAKPFPFPVGQVQKTPWVHRGRVSWKGVVYIVVGVYRGRVSWKGVVVIF